MQIGAPRRGVGRLRWPAMGRVLRLALTFSILTGCAAMHEEMVRQMRADGDPRAGCYAACEPGDVMCTNDCDRAHQSSQPATATQDLGNDILSSAMSGNVTESDINRLQHKQQEAMKQETQRGLMQGRAPSSAPRSSVTEERTEQPAPADPTACPEGCPEGERCVTLLAGTKQCAPGGKCTTVEETHGECRPKPASEGDCT